MTPAPANSSDRRRLTPARRLVALALFLLLGAGCAGYQLGPSNGTRAGSHSIEVTPFVNATTEPRLTEPVTRQLRQQLQTDGTYRLNTRGDADVVVTGTLLRYERLPLTFQPNDIITTRDYDVKLTARVHAVDRTSGRILIDREVTGRTTIRNTSNLPAAERQASSLLAEDLARIITSLLVDGSW